MKLNLDWINTDWSVSKLKRSSDNANPENRKPMTRNAPLASTPGRNVVRRPMPQHPADSFAAALERARHDAIALAWSTNYPLLVLPCLKEELEQRAEDYFERQNQVKARSQEVLRATFPAATSFAA